METGDHDPLDRDEAQEILAQVELVQRQVRGSLLSGNWWLFVGWGAIILGSLVPTLYAGREIGWYWVVAAPLGAIASYVAGFRLSEDVGTSLSAWPYVATGAAIFAGTFGSSFFLSGAAAVTGVFVSLIAGFSVFAFLDRQYGGLAMFGLLTIMVGALPFVVDDTATVYAMDAIAVGTAFAALGLGLRVGRPRRGSGRRT